MRLVQNQRKVPVPQLAHLAQHIRKLMQRGDDDQPPLAQRLGRLAAVAVDLFLHAILVDAQQRIAV